MLEQSQQAQGNKAPGAPDGYLTAAQLLTLMGGMSGLPGMDDSIGDPTVPGVKWPFNATDNTEALGNIADKVNDDPLGYLDGLIDDLINPRDDGLVGAQSGPQQNDAPTIDIGAQGDESGDGTFPGGQIFREDGGAGGHPGRRDRPRGRDLRGVHVGSLRPALRRGGAGAAVG